MENPNDSEGLDLSNFTIEQYSSGREEQTKYIKAAFARQGEVFERNELGAMRAHPDSELMISFFRTCGFGPATRYGQLVQMIVCEERIAKLISGIYYGGTKPIVLPRLGGKAEPSQRAQAKL